MIDISNFVWLPVVIPLAGAMIALLLRGHSRLQAYWSFGVILTSFMSSAYLLWIVWSSGSPLVSNLGGWRAPFGIVFVADLFSAFMVVMVQIVIVHGMLYALGAKDAVVKYPGFYTLFLTLATGLTGAMLTGDLFNLFVFVELLVISGAILTAASDDRYGIEAAYKYLYISLLASFFLLLGTGTLYVAYGTLNLAQLGEMIINDPSPHPLLPAAIGLLLATFMVKSAVFPFHFWQPDFHTASPTPVHAILSSVVVKLGIYGFYRMTTLLFIDQASVIQLILLITGIIGVFYGGLGAIGTYNAKRMLAYSTMGQIGFILVGIGWGTPFSMAAALVFSFNHSLIKAAMLMLAGGVASRVVNKSADFSVIVGIGKKVPIAGVLFFIGGMGLAGVPPTNGFISKLLLFQSGVEAVGYLPLILLVGGGALSLIYSIRAFQQIWWEDQNPTTELKKKGDVLIAPGLLIAFVLIFGLFPDPLVSLASSAIEWLFDPNIYIQAVMGGL